MLCLAGGIWASNDGTALIRGCWKDPTMSRQSQLKRAWMFMTMIYTTSIFRQISARSVMLLIAKRRGKLWIPSS